MWSGPTLITRVKSPVTCSTVPMRGTGRQRSQRGQLSVVAGLRARDMAAGRSERIAGSAG